MIDMGSGCADDFKKLGDKFKEVIDKVKSW